MVSDSADSLLAFLGHAVAPIFTPPGFGDWRMVTALVTGITAKEAVVSTLAVLFSTDVDALSTVIKKEASLRLRTRRRLLWKLRRMLPQIRCRF